MTLNRIYSITTFLLLTVLTACGTLFDDPQAGPGLETGNVGGTVLASDSIVVVGAEVQLFVAKRGIDSVNTAPTPLQTTITDENGNYSFSVTEHNTYTVVAKSVTEVAFIDSLILFPDTKVVQDINLKAPGSIAGHINNRVELLSPHTVIAYLLGTSFYLNLSDSGAFTMNGVPEGIYTLILIPNQDDFSNTALSVTVTSGVATIIPEPIELRYGGVPIPVNVSTGYNSKTGVAHISWAPVDYSHFQEFLIERNSGTNLEPNWVLVGRTTDTTFSDEIYNQQLTAVFDYHDTTTYSFEYRVRVRSTYSEIDGSLMDGKANGYSSITVVSPRHGLPYANAFYDTFIVDSIPLVTLSGHGSSSQGPLTMAWDIGNTGVFEPTIDGTISFLYYEKDIVEVSTCIFKVTDSNGVSAFDTTLVSVNHSSFVPKAFAGENVRVGKDTTVTLIGTVFAPLGIQTQEWKIGDDEWISGDSISFTTNSEVAEDTIVAYFRVTQINNASSKDTVFIVSSLKQTFHSLDLPFPIGRTSFLINNDILLAVIDDQTWASTDGINWILKSSPSNLPKFSLTDYPSRSYTSRNDSIHLYIIDTTVSNSELFQYSTIDGASWSKQSIPIELSPNTYIESITSTSDSIYLLLTENTQQANKSYLIKTTDFSSIDTIQKPSTSFYTGSNYKTHFINNSVCFVNEVIPLPIYNVKCLNNYTWTTTTFTENDLAIFKDMSSLSWYRIFESQSMAFYFELVGYGSSLNNGNLLFLNNTNGSRNLISSDFIAEGLTPILFQNKLMSYTTEGVWVMPYPVE